MNLASLIETHGYTAAFIGAMLEGETVLTLAGLAAHRGYLHLPLLTALSALGGFAGDQAYFELGRRYGEGLLTRFPHMRPVADRATALLAKRPIRAILAVRFLYGMRTAGPIAIGMSALPWRTFALYNALSALLWAACWIGAGYVLGSAVETMLGDLRRVEKWLFAVATLLAIGVALWLRHHRRTKGGALLAPRHPHGESRETLTRR